MDKASTLTEQRLSTDGKTSMLIEQSLSTDRQILNTDRAEPEY